MKLQSLNAVIKTNLIEWELCKCKWLRKRTGLNDVEIVRVFYFGSCSVEYWLELRKDTATKENSGTQTANQTEDFKNTETTVSKTYMWDLQVSSYCENIRILGLKPTKICTLASSKNLLEISLKNWVYNIFLLVYA